MSTQATKYGCLMLSLPIKKWDTLQTAINQKDLWTDVTGFGKELQPHVTILYGFHDNVDPHWIKDCVYSLNRPIELELKSISHFDNPVYEALKFDVHSDRLHRLHEIFAKFPHTDTYPEYHPHATIAYVKKGMAEKYHRILEKPIRVVSNTFIYSVPNGNSYEWTNDKRIDIKRNKFYPSQVSRI